jgi:eukaryotic-like serine/threonine-protein kinase
VALTYRELLEIIRTQHVSSVHHLETFEASQDAGDVDRLLEYLFEQEVLDGEQFRSFHTKGGPELTNVESFMKLRELAGADRGLRRRYSPLGKLAGGSMGQIYVAKETDLNRKVAFKQIASKLGERQGLLRRFVQEVQITAQLDHPNIVPVYGLEATPEGSLGYAMKLVHGRTFEALVADVRNRHQAGERVAVRRELTERLDLFLRICDAVSYAHSRGVIHRDLKPANIMVGAYGEVYVMDWGLARMLDGSDNESEEGLELIAGTSKDSTQMGDAVGTPAYMAPEQARGLNEQLDPRSDLYSLGLILHELITLKPALSGVSVSEVLIRAAKGERDPFVYQGGKFSIPVELGAVVGKATQLHPNRRYASVAAFAADVRCFLRDEPVLARPDSPVRKLTRWIGKNQLLVVVVMLVVVLGAASAVISSLVMVQEAERESQERQARLGAAVTSISTQAHQIDSELMRFERLLEATAAATAQVLQHARVDPDLPVYTTEDFDGDSPPEGTRYSKFHDMDVNYEWPVFKAALGADLVAATKRMKRMSELRDLFRSTLLRSHADALTWEFDWAKELLRNKGTPLVWVYAGMEDGIHTAFPGHGGYDEQYDPRERPWYRLSAYKHGLFWGNAYVDASGHGLLLPCSTSIYDQEGDFIGVVGVDVSFRYLIDGLLRLEGMEGSVAYLVDDFGREVVRSDMTLADYEQRIYDNRAKELPEFPVPDVVRSIKSAEAGGYFPWDEEEKLVVYSRLNAMGWYYVVVVESDQIF